MADPMCALACKVSRQGWSCRRFEVGRSFRIARVHSRALHVSDPGLVMVGGLGVRSAGRRPWMVGGRCLNGLGSVVGGRL